MFVCFNTPEPTNEVISGTLEKHDSIQRRWFNPQGLDLNSPACFKMSTTLVLGSGLMKNLSHIYCWVRLYVRHRLNSERGFYNLWKMSMIYLPGTFIRSFQILLALNNLFMSTAASQYWPEIFPTLMNDFRLFQNKNITGIISLKAL